MAKKKRGPGRPKNPLRPPLDASPERSTQGEQRSEPQATPEVDLSAQTERQHERQAQQVRRDIHVLREEIAESKLTDPQRITLQLVREQAEMSRILTPEQIREQPLLREQILSVPIWTLDKRYVEKRVYRVATDRHGQMEGAVMRRDQKVMADGVIWLLVTQLNHPEVPASEFDASGVIHPKGRRDHYLLFTMKDTWDALQLERAMRQRRKMDVIEKPRLRDGQRAGPAEDGLSASMTARPIGTPASGRADDLGEGEGAEIAATIQG